MSAPRMSLGKSCPSSGLGKRPLSPTSLLDKPAPRLFRNPLLAKDSCLKESTNRRIDGAREGKAETRSCTHGHPPEEWVRAWDMRITRLRPLYFGSRKS